MVATFIIFQKAFSDLFIFQHFPLDVEKWLADSYSENSAIERKITEVFSLKFSLVTQIGN